MQDSAFLIIVSTVISAISCCFYYVASASFLHCFYDDSIRVTKKRVLCTFGGILILPFIWIPYFGVGGFIYGFIQGVTEGADSEAFQVTIEASDMIARIITIPIYIWMLWMIAYQKNIKFKKAVQRLLTALVFLMILVGAIDLLTEMGRYCITETGLLGMHISEIQSEDMIIKDLCGTVLLVMVMLLLYFRIYKKDIRLRLRKVDGMAVLLYGGIEVMLTALFSMLEKQKISLAGGNILLRVILIAIMVLLLIVMPVLIIRSRISASYQERNAYQENFLETELNASRQYKAAQEDTRAFRHDVQNNLTAIAMLMQEGKIDEAQRYLNDMRTEVNALSPKIVTGDDMVDSLISAKLMKMEEAGITFKIDGVIDGGLKWKPMDICTVFANLLDNAIEAAGQTENGFITIEFRKSEHHRLIRASNSCAEDVDCEALMSGSHITSKADAALHGYGIGNIRKTVEKYGGMMKLFCENHVFTAEIILQR